MTVQEYLVFAEYMHKVRMGALGEQEISQLGSRVPADAPQPPGNGDTGARIASPEAVADFREWQRRKGLQ